MSVCCLTTTTQELLVCYGDIFEMTVQKLTKLTGVICTETNIWVDASVHASDETACSGE